MGSGQRSKAGAAFHYLNAQKRILREYARTHLTLGVHWRQSLGGACSSRGVKLEVTPSSEWTQFELDTLYEVWGLNRPSPNELRENTSVSLLFKSPSSSSTSSSSSIASGNSSSSTTTSSLVDRQRSISCSSLSTLSFSGSEEGDDSSSSVDGGEASNPPCGKPTAPRKSSSLKRKATQAELDQEILDSRTVTVEELREGLDFDLLPFLGIGEPILFPNYEDLLGLL